jgi:oxygen-independent coproporphyrinogen-3 oxidase
MAKDLSLYIHIPFCKSRCMYCNFLTFAGKNDWIQKYVKALEQEIKKRSKNQKNKVIETIYFGGGTPSLIDPILIKKIIHLIMAYFKVKRGAEVSIECNPESVDKNRLEIYKKAGVTRFSLGVQSLNKKTLWRIARPHDSETIFKALDCFKKAKIKDFGVDFIIGLPFQTLKIFKKEIETILKYKPMHTSAYFLSYDTPKIDNFIKECPCEEKQIKMYEWLCKRLIKAKFAHYEISNWACVGFECKHNKRYWEQKDYLGLGLGAHSIIDSEMWENQRDLAAYIKNPMKICEEMGIDEDLKRMEYLMLSLRTNAGINLKKYAKLGNVKELLKNAAPYLKTGQLKKIGDRLFATEKGFLVTERILERVI